MPINVETLTAERDAAAKRAEQAESLLVATDRERKAAVDRAQRADVLADQLKISRAACELLGRQYNEIKAERNAALHLEAQAEQKLRAAEQLNEQLQLQLVDLRQELSRAVPHAD